MFYEQQESKNRSSTKEYLHLSQGFYTLNNYAVYNLSYTIFYNFSSHIQKSLWAFGYPASKLPRNQLIILGPIILLQSS